MKKYLLCLLLASGILLAKSDFSAMSAQELIALIGYVKPEEKRAFLQELELRKPTFTQSEQQQYERSKQQKSR